MSRPRLLKPVISAVVRAVCVQLKVQSAKGAFGLAHLCNNLKPGMNVNIFTTAPSVGRQP